MRHTHALRVVVGLTLAAAAVIAVAACVDPGGPLGPEGALPSVGVARNDVIGPPRLCGGCDPDCRLTSDEPIQSELDGDARVWGESTAYDPAKGGIVIVPPGVRVTSMYAWLANTAISTVTKIHLQAMTPRGVYRVGLESVGAGGNYPSRTTVDILGCAYVAQRAFGAQGSVTKIAGDLEDCSDLNGNGVIDTSTGLGDIRGWPGTSTQDECVLWNVPVGPRGGTPRALAVDAMGRIWVGLFSSQQFVVLDSIDGHVISTINVDISPYGAAITPGGLLWASGSGYIQSINTYTLLPTDADVGPLRDPPYGQYGIAIDGDDRVWVSNWDSGGIQRYTPGTDTWDTGDNGAYGRTSGISVMEGGRIFGSDIYDSHVTMYDSESLAILEGFNTGASGGASPHGVCPDFFGNVWTGNMGSANSTVMTPGGGVIATVTVQSWNYTYSDFTGYGLMTFAAMVGYVFRDYDSVAACGGPSMRERVYWNATFPNPGVINFHGRSADTLAGLDTAPETWLGTAETATGSVPIRGPMSDDEASRRYFRLRMELLRAGPESPVLHNYTVEEYCE